MHRPARLNEIAEGSREEQSRLDTFDGLLSALERVTDAHERMVRSDYEGTEFFAERMAVVAEARAEIEKAKGATQS